MMTMALVMPFVPEASGRVDPMVPPHRPCHFGDSMYHPQAAPMAIWVLPAGVSLPMAVESVAFVEVRGVTTGGQYNPALSAGSKSVTLLLSLGGSSLRS